MFLKRLDQIEKEAFVSLAVLAAEANGVVADEEYQLLEEYCEEMGIAFFDARNVKPIEDVIKVFADSDDQHKKIAVLEIIGLMYADGEYDETEKAFVTKFADGIGVSHEVVKKSEEALVKYIDMTRDLLECIEWWGKLPLTVTGV